MEGQGSIIKKFEWKNPYFLSFLIIGLFLLIIGLIRDSSSLPEKNILFALINLFNWYIWVSLGILFCISSGLAYYKKFKLMFIPLIIILLFLSVFVRTSNISNLKDVSTGGYSLGPDLDPFLYLRHATEIINKTSSSVDHLRVAPLGTENYAYKNMMAFAIIVVYKFLNIYSDTSLLYGAIISPVIFFSLSILAFFLFVFLLFSAKLGKMKAGITAFISSLFYTFTPQMLHRTIAGVPELESLGMLWFWLAFIFLLLAWKNEKIWKMSLFGLLAGVFTGAMSWTWGGYRYIYMALVLTSLIIFLLNKEFKKNLIIYISWAIPALIAELIRLGSLKTLIFSVTDTGLSILLLFVFAIHIVLIKTNLGKKLETRLKIQSSLISVIISLIIILLFLLIIDFSFLSSMLTRVSDGFLYPFGRGRVGLTVAENKQPYFTEVFSSFRYLFWTFFLGSLLIFYDLVSHFKKKYKIVLNLSFLILLSGLIFSRFSPDKLLNGDNKLSYACYFGAMIIFLVALGFIYIKSYKDKDDETIKNFKDIKFNYLFFLVLIFWMIVSMRGAVRLFFVISPFLIIASGYLPVRLYSSIKSQKDNLLKIIFWAVVIAIILVLGYTFLNESFETSYTARYVAPSQYNYQWQYAMQWVRENTPVESIFAHWWDYGYWIQTLGERATVTDGGHQAGIWNYYLGRHFLCGNNETDALEFLYSHNVSYVLIDSSDIGKYSAYSSIGSNPNMDKYSFVGTFLMDESQTQETKNKTINIYPGSAVLDEDLLIGDKFFPGRDDKGNPYTGVIGVIIPFLKSEGEINQIEQPEIVLVNNNKQERVKIRYVYMSGELYDFGSGIESGLYITDRVTSTSINKIGTILYLSERGMKAQWARMYMLNETENFELVHTEEDLITLSVRSQGFNVNEIAYYDNAGGVRGPIKIWAVDYPPGFKVNEELKNQYLRITGSFE